MTEQYKNEKIKKLLESMLPEEELENVSGGAESKKYELWCEKCKSIHISCADIDDSGNPIHAGCGGKLSWFEMTYNEDGDLIGQRFVPF